MKRLYLNRAFEHKRIDGSVIKWPAGSVTVDDEMGALMMRDGAKEAAEKPKAKPEPKPTSGKRTRRR